MKRIEYFFKKVRIIVQSNKKYLTKKFIKNLGYIPDFEHPVSFNEKINARMLSVKNPLYARLANKLSVRDFVTNKIGYKYLVPLIGIYEKFEDINFDKLPKKFVIKCNHDSGSTIICNKFDFDEEKCARRIKNYQRKNMYFITREWQYKTIKPVIMIEELIDLYVDYQSHATITTCRVHCFEGIAKYIEIDITDKKGVAFTNIYNVEWELQPFTVDEKENTKFLLRKPKLYNLMLSLAEKLCFAYGYTRVDFLLSKDYVFFSEITLTPNAGRMKITPVEWDFKLGELWL